ncbi:hypothetical protein SESBI_06571 [Sesbania bispinosa]|nr:hypothetical protein SESBI_06571 [Sesbania bispinosa]
MRLALQVVRGGARGGAVARERRGLCREEQVVGVFCASTGCTVDGGSWKKAAALQVVRGGARGGAVAREGQGLCREEQVVGAFCASTGYTVDGGSWKKAVAPVSCTRMARE